MTQEVRVMLQLTLDVDVRLSKEDIQRKIEFLIEEGSRTHLLGLDLQMTDVIEIREEAEIYGNE